MAPTTRLRTVPSSQDVRVLRPEDLDETLELLGDHPAENCFLEHRVRTTGLDPRWVGAEVWAYGGPGALSAVCHAGANLVPSAGQSPDAAEAFARRALDGRRRSDAVFGPRAEVRQLWDHLGPRWDAQVREYRWHQPLLAIDSDPPVAPDTRVRRGLGSDMAVLYPACVRMSTEEVGVSPESGGNAPLYRARISQLVDRGWSFVRIEDDLVVFKAEVAAATPYACQVQGVYVDPTRRGEGISAPAMAAVVVQALRDIAPLVTLYVNDFNVAARATYARAGFRDIGSYSTIMF